MKRRQTYPYPPKNRGWAGEDSADGLVDDMFAMGWLAELRNYHLLRGSLQKREGHLPYIDAAMNGSAAGQGVGLYDFAGTRKMVGQAGNKILMSTGTSWSDITGTLTPTAGANILLKTCLFHNGTNGLMLGANGTDNPWYYAGTGNATALPITTASDLAPFKHFAFAIGTSDGPCTTRWGAPGIVTTWTPENLFDCTRDSVGIALTPHNQETLLAFHEHSVHAINYNYGVGAGVTSYFTNRMVDPERGAASRTGVATYKGVTYFVSDDGFYRIKNPDYPAEYISRTQEGFWATLNPARKKYITAIVRGEPWNEILFLVSTGSNTQHNAIMVYNHEIARMFGPEAGWSIFDSSEAALKFNAGTNWIDSDGYHRTIMQSYGGVAHQAFGIPTASAGYLDGASGSLVETILKTGYLDFGYDGIKGLREMIMDLKLETSRSFNLQVTGIDENPQISRDVSIGTAADELNVDFMLDESYLAASGASHAQFQTPGNSRLFQFRLQEKTEGAPHSIYSLLMLYVRKGIRIQ